MTPPTTRASLARAVALLEQLVPALAQNAAELRALRRVLAARLPFPVDELAARAAEREGVNIERDVEREAARLSRPRRRM